MKIPHVGYEVTKEVGKVVQELQGTTERRERWSSRSGKRIEVLTLEFFLFKLQRFFKF